MIGLTVNILKAQTDESFYPHLSTTQLADSFKVLNAHLKKLYGSSGWQKLNRDSTLELATKGLRLADAYNDSTESSNWLYQLGYIHMGRGETERAIIYFSLGIEMFKGLNDSLMEMYTLRMRGYNYLVSAEFEKASKDYTNAILIGESLKDSTILLETYLSLVDLYFQADEEKVLPLDLKSIEAILEKVKPLVSPDESVKLLARNYKSNARLLGKKGDYAEGIRLMYLAISQYDSVKHTKEILRTKLTLAAQLLYWGDALKEQGKGQLAKDKYKQAKEIYLRFIDYYKKGDNRAQLISGYVNIGAANKRMNLLAQAVDTLNLALNFAAQIGQKHQKARAYRLLSEVYEQSGLVDSSLVMFNRYLLLRDSIANEKVKKGIFISEEIINLDMKRISLERQRVNLERQAIEDQQKLERQEQQRRTQLLIALIITISLASTGGYFYYRARTQRRLREQQGEINRQIVVDLMKEQAIENLNSRLEGQDQERERIARDLHDRLGGTLSATKMHLERLGKKITPELSDPYQETYKLLDLATKETRQISHDMMALPLMQMGFEASVKELCKTINASGKIKAQFNAYHQAQLEPSEKTKRHLYHVVQELLQNIIKHAEASQVFVQLYSEPDSIRLMVEDDGKGFDTAKQSKGMGLSNIEDRIKQLNGTIDIDSYLGRGTTVMLEIPV